MKLARFEGYYDDAKPEFDALAKKLSHNVAKDLDYNKQSSSACSKMILWQPTIIRVELSEIPYVMTSR